MNQTNCRKENGYLICYCGKCEPEDYPLPRDFMNQTKPKTIEQILNKFDEYKTEEYGKWKIGRVEARDFIRTSITTLLESFNTEFWDAPGSFTAGYNARNRELEKEINKILGI